MNGTLPYNPARVVLFLDIDGVLNNGIDCRHDDGWYKPSCVAAFNRLITATNAQVVLHSSWNALVHEGHMTVCGFNIFLRSHGVRCDLIGVTRRDPAPYLGLREWPDYTRATQVRDWLADHPGAGRYVVLDDMDDGFSATGMPFVWTASEIGLTEADADRAIALLTGQGG